MALDEIKNYLAIDVDGDERVGTAGQPSEDELREVAADGYRAVVNLGLLNPEYCLPDEAGLAASLGLAYRHIPVSFDAPTVADFEAFVAQRRAPGDSCRRHTGCRGSSVRRRTSASRAPASRPGRGR